MDALAVARWQFAIVTVYHFFFVPITLGLSVAIAIMETKYVRSGDVKYKQMTKFWGKLFLINFAIGVATGIVQEFQFGMNWSQYSRFMGDIFGAPLAIEALLAFYMESTFIGIWIFGWDKISPKLHATVMWLTAIGSNLSAIWILTANSFMQHPVGYTINQQLNRAEMNDFFAVIGNPHVWHQFPHVFFAGMTGAGFIIMGISLYHIVKTKKNLDAFKTSFKFGALYGLIGIILVITIGHFQAQLMTEIQPMKMAAGEALWEDENPAALSLFTIADEDEQVNSVDFRIPNLLSFLVYDKFEGPVRGIKSLQKEYEEKYGPGDYIPPVNGTYWNFRIMVGLGFLMLFMAIYAYWKARKDDYNFKPWVYKLFIWGIFFPIIASSTGWIFTEIGRQPWTVFGLFKTSQSVSNTVSAGEVWFSLISYTIVYAALIVVMVKLFKKYAVKGMDEEETAENVSNTNLSEA